MNKEWLAFIISLWFMLFFVAYFGLIPAIYESDEDNVQPRILKFINAVVEHTGRLGVMLMAAVMPLVLLRFTFGIYQSDTKDKGKKWFGHVVGALNLALIFCIYRYYVPSS